MPGIATAVGTPFRKIKADKFPSIISDGTTSMRWIEVGDYMEMQLTLTAVGFAGTKDVDYEAVEKIRT